MPDDELGKPDAAPLHSRATLNAGLWSMVGTAVQFLLTTLTLVVTSRMVEVTAFGGLVAALSVITIFLTLVRLMVSQYVIQQRADAGRLRRLHRRVIVGSIVAALAGCYWATDVAYLLNVPEAADAFVILWVSTIFVAIGSVAVAKLQLRLEFRLLTFIQATSTVLYAGATIGLCLLAPGVVALAVGQAVLFASIGLLAWLLGREDGPVDIGSPLALDRALVMPQPLSKGVWLPTSIMSLCVVGAQQVDNLIAGLRLGAGGLSLYSRAYRISAVPANLFSDAFSAVLFPAMANRQESLRTLRRVLYLGLICILVTTVPAALLTAWDAQDIVIVTLGTKWAAASAAAAFLFGAFPLRLSLKFCASVLQSRGALSRMASGYAVYCVFVVIGAILGATGGVTGVGVGVCVANILGAAVMYVLLGQLRPTAGETLVLLGIIVTIAGITACARYMISGTNLSGWALLIIDAIITVVIGATPFLTTRGAVLRAERAGIRSLLGLDRLTRKIRRRERIG